MSTLSVDLLHGKATLKGAAMRIQGVRWPKEASSSETQESVDTLFPLHEIELLIITPATTMSGALVQALMLAGIPVILMGGHGYDILGSILPSASASGGLRIKQYEFISNAERRLRISRLLVESKLYNQRRIIAKKGAKSDTNFCLHMQKLRHNAKEAPDIHTLMGIEGQGSACYFTEWAKGLPHHASFPGRNRRPPRDPVNSCLSFLSALCHTDMLSAIVQSGLDPDLGVMHSPNDYRHNLALDLMEPFRPPLVEGVTRDIFSHDMLSPKDTEYRENGGCYLTAQGRATVIRKYEYRIRQRFHSPSLGHHTDLRQAMRTVSASFKHCILNPNHQFTPFYLP